MIDNPKKFREILKENVKDLNIPEEEIEILVDLIEKAPHNSLFGKEVSEKIETLRNKYIKGVKHASNRS